LTLPPKLLPVARRQADGACLKLGPGGMSTTGLLDAIGVGKGIPSKPMHRVRDKGTGTKRTSQKINIKLLSHHCLQKSSVT
jgi:hypothetical protein